VWLEGVGFEPTKDWL